MSLQTRVVAILTKPADEWRTIAAEPATVESLMRGYAAPLAAIPAVCQFIGYSLVGIPTPVLGTIRIGIVRGLVSACLGVGVCARRRLDCGGRDRKARARPSSRAATPRRRSSWSSIR